MTDNDRKPPVHQPPAQQPRGQPNQPHQPGQPHPGAGQHGEHGSKESPLIGTGMLGEQHGEDDHANKTADQVGVKPMTTEQAVTEPSSPPHVGGRAMFVLVGPYKGSILTMPEDEAENAKDNHWAIDQADMEPPFDAANPYEHDHDLTDEDRENAVREAEEWAAKVNAPPDEAAPEGETEAQREAREKRNADRKKALQPEQHPAQRPRGDYLTRGDHLDPDGRPATGGTPQPPFPAAPPKHEPPKPEPRRR